MLKRISTKNASCDFKTFIKVSLFLCCLNFSFSYAINHNSEYSGYDDSENEYTELDDNNYALDLAIKLKQEFGDDLVSDLFATSYGLEKVARVADLDQEENLFHFKLTNPLLDTENMEQNEIPKEAHVRRKRHVFNKVEELRQDDRVEYVLPQRYLTREKRDGGDVETNELYREIEEILDDELEVEPRKNYKLKNGLDIILEQRLEELTRELENEQKIKRKNMQEHLAEEFLKKIDLDAITGPVLDNEIDFNDKNYKQEWYLINDGQLNIPNMHDLNVKQAWLKGFTGKNISIVIIDDGIDHEHPDFFGKYRPDLSYDFNDENDTEHDPMPSTFDNQNNHGTRCAGAAVANANNSVCGVGVAFDAQIGGIRILDGPITDLLEARALSYKSKDVDIKSASWGPRDDGAHMEYPGKFVNLALEDGVKNGRNGKGTLFIWASGNGGGNDDDCSCDGYVSNWNIISIGAVNHHGLMPYFMERCPSTMAVVYAGGKSDFGGKLDDPGVRVVASDVRGKCTTAFQGTSAAAPLAAGAFALVLESNPELTYRDIMHLIAKTSRIPNIEDMDGWIINGAKYHVNDKYGFGVLDISNMLQEAQGWENVGKRQKCVVDYNGKLPEMISSEESLVLTIDVDGCENLDTLEHVVGNISFSFSNRGSLKLTLVSPHETPSEILSYRKNDKTPKGVKYFPFMTLFNWGESPVGKWKLIIESKSKEDQTPNTGHIEHFSLIFYGTKSIGSKNLNKRYFDRNSRAFVPSSDDIKRIYDAELKLKDETKIVHKRFFEENFKKKDSLK